MWQVAGKRPDNRVFYTFCVDAAESTELGYGALLDKLIGKTEADNGEVIAVIVHPLQLLHVLKSTRLAETDYVPLGIDEYYRLLGLCLEHLRPDIVIHRLTGDGDKRQLIAPMWSGDKHRVLNGFMRYMDEHDIIQGSKYENSSLY